MNVTHYLGTSYATSTACGRQVLVWRDRQPLTTDELAAVTCRACLKASPSSR